MLLLINFSMCQTFGDYLWYLLNMNWGFRISLNWYCFIFMTVTFVFSIIVSPKITYSYWFIIILFFMRKKILNILEILSLIRLSDIFNCFSFFSPKWFLKSLIIFSSSSFKLSIIICCEKNHFFETKNEALSCSFRKH